LGRQNERISSDRRGAGDEGAGSDFAGVAKRITWWQAAEIIGISDRHMRRWRQRYEEQGYDGLFDRRRGKPSPKRVPLEQAEEVLRLYREKYFDLNLRHCHEKLREVHGISLSYTWVKQALQGAGL
jgi:transposase